VHITADLNRCLQFKEHRLTNQQITTAETEHLDFGFGKVYLLSRSSAANTEKKQKIEMTVLDLLFWQDTIDGANSRPLKFSSGQLLITAAGSE
jgi:hypothetical protein